MGLLLLYMDEEEEVVVEGTVMALLAAVLEEVLARERLDILPDDDGKGQQHVLFWL